MNITLFFAKLFHGPPDLQIPAENPWFKCYKHDNKVLMRNLQLGKMAETLKYEITQIGDRVAGEVSVKT